MAERTFASLIPRVNPSAPGCPQPLILQAIRDAAIRTCERTLAWRQVAPKMALMPGVHEYEYPKPAGTDVHAVFSAVLNEQSILQPITLDAARELYPAWADLYSGVAPDELWTGTPSGTFGAFGYGAGAFNAGGPAEMTDAAMEKASEPRVIVTVTPDRFVVLPLPDNAKPYSLRLIYALKPKRSATGMDSVIMDELEDLLVHSALQDLLVMPSTNWGDRELAAYHAKQYLSRVTERRARANLGTARGTLRVKHLPFA